MRAIAERHGMTVSEWVRQAVRAARRQVSDGGTSGKLAAV